MKTRYAAQRHIDAPAEVVYHCLADYREHHRPEGFLPPAFSDFELLEGGVGAGTRASWSTTVGGQKRHMTAVITEPEPGRVLLETATGVVTTFTVTPSGAGCVATFDSVFDEPGVGGVLLRLFIGRTLGPIYADELARLDVYAREHGPVASPVMAPADTTSAASAPAPVPAGVVEVPQRRPAEVRLLDQPPASGSAAVWRR
jgi:hypothetical protein